MVNNIKGFIMPLSAKEEQQVIGLGVGLGASILKKLLTKGANLPPPPAIAVNFYRADGTEHSKDTRVTITVPIEYHGSRLMQGGATTLNYPISVTRLGLAAFSGIIFPYTPTISYEHKATYTAQNPTHSNFSQQFYQNSSVSPISISGKFTVENEADAAHLLMTLHLLKTLTKMKQGEDTNAGAPPPVCRLSAYGNFMLENVPVVISSFKHELPDNVDYFTTAKRSEKSTINRDFANNSVPTLSSITLSCIPVYSRKQMTEFSVDRWLSGALNQQNEGKGYL